MKAIKFTLQNVVNPQTGEELQRIMTEFDNGEEMKLLVDDIDVFKQSLKEDRAAIVDKISVRSGEFGRYCVISRAEFVEVL